MRLLAGVRWPLRRGAPIPVTAAPRRAHFHIQRAARILPSRDQAVIRPWWPISATSASHGDQRRCTPRREPHATLGTLKRVCHGAYSVPDPFSLANRARITGLNHAGELAATAQHAVDPHRHCPSTKPPGPRDLHLTAQIKPARVNRGRKRSALVVLQKKPYASSKSTRSPLHFKNNYSYAQFLTF